MAIALTDLGGNVDTTNPATSVTVTTTIAIPAGAKVLAFVGYKPLATVSVTVNGNAATQVQVSNRTTVATSWLFYYDSAAGEASGIAITANFSGTTSSGAQLICAYLTGAVAGNTTVIGATTGLSAAPSSGASSTPSTGINYLAVAGYTLNVASTTNSPAGGWSTLPVQNAAVRNEKSAVAYTTLTANVAATTETWTDTSGQWAGLIALFAEAAAAAAGGPPAARPLIFRLAGTKVQPWLWFPSPAGVTVTAQTFPQDLIATVTTSSSFTNQIGKIMSATQATSATISRQVGKTMSATSTLTASIAKQVAKTLSATVTLTASMVAMKVILKAMTASVTLSASMVRQVNKTLSATATLTAQIVKRVNKGLSATVTLSASLVGIKVILRTLSATVTVTGSMVRSVGKPLTATVSLTASVVKQVAKTLTRTVTVTASLLAQKVFLKSLTATVTTTASMVRRVNSTLTATVTTVATVVKQIRKTITATVSSVASLVADAIFPGAIQVVGYFMSKARGMTGSSPKEPGFQDTPGGQTGSSPSSGEFDHPGPKGQ